MSWRTFRMVAVVVLMALLSVGTISGQVRINSTNARIAAQADAGARGLVRQCRLLPVGKKLYGDALERGKITPADYELVISTADTACFGQP